MDLSTRYMGLHLKHPLVASAGPISTTIDGMKKLEDGGAAAIVMFSLFEEQIRRENESFDHYLEANTERFAESLSFFPAVEDYHVGPESYLSLIRMASEALDIPIIASLNGVTNEGWTDYARQLEEAGAKGLELNVYYIPADLDMSGRAVENLYVDILRTVKGAVSIPVAMKLNPYFSAMGNMARQLDQAGADALVLFNRFYQPDFDLEQLAVLPSLELSSPSELRLPLLWTAILYGKLDCSLAATTGVHSAGEAIKYLLAGSDVVMSTSALLKHGPGHIDTLLEGLRNWMQGRGFANLTQMRGVMSQRKVEDPTAFERANYIKVLEGYKSNPYLHG